MGRWTKEIEVGIATGLAFDEASNAVWFVAVDGRLGSFRMVGSTVRWHGGGWLDAVAAVASADGLNVLVLSAAGKLYVAARDGADAASSSLVVDLGRVVLAAAALPDGALVVLSDDGVILSLDGATGATTTVVGGLDGAQHLVLDAATGDLLVALGGAAPELVRIDPATGDVVGAALALAQPAVALTSHPSGGAIVADASGTLRAVRWTSPDADVQSVAGVSALGTLAQPRHGRSSRRPRPRRVGRRFDVPADRRRPCAVGPRRMGTLRRGLRRRWGRPRLGRMAGGRRPRRGDDLAGAASERRPHALRAPCARRQRSGRADGRGAG